MDFSTFILLLIFLLPFIIYTDSTANPEENPQGSELIISLLPLCAFFYSEDYWHSLFILALVMVYGVALKILAHRKGILHFDTALLKSHCVGTITLGVCGYVLYLLVTAVWAVFFGGDAPSEAQVAAGSIADTTENTPFWPFVIYAVLVLAIFLAIFTDQGRGHANKLAPYALFGVMAGFVMLPWFTSFYWLLMLGGALLFLFITEFMCTYKTSDQTGVGGIMFFYGYVYMLASVMSVLIYLIFF
ncbi:hypothetical protein SG34_011785 [Thalassomonas viridans]|uniref:Uncharacterized protein n=1 Tax=Thalassomonas viridans TaxID=137584 RepID=A0AAF0CB23_9GAMM|nr:hypothetical protein [Thalassomonas viridans]WDE07498.1 hypothetical protein SG34_011785 [Thalassomonas viridans]